MTTRSLTPIFVAIFFLLLATSAACATASDEPDSPAETEQPESAEEPEASKEVEEAETPEEPEPPEESEPPQGKPPQLGNFCDPDHIRSVVREHSDAIRYCYERELLEKPELEGRIDMFWLIDLDGMVSIVEIKNSEIGDENVENCIVGVIDEMTFDEPNGGMCEINYPFIFTGLDNDDEADE